MDTAEQRLNAHFKTVDCRWFIFENTFNCCGASEPEASERCSRLICAVGNRWESCLSMREQNKIRNCVEYTQRVFTKRHNRVNIAKCLYKINDCFMLKMDMI